MLDGMFNIKLNQTRGKVRGKRINPLILQVRKMLEASDQKLIVMVKG